MNTFTITNRSVARLLARVAVFAIIVGAFAMPFSVTKAFELEAVDGDTPVVLNIAETETPNMGVMAGAMVTWASDVVACTDSSARNYQEEAVCEYGDIQDTIEQHTQTHDRNWCEPDEENTVPVELCKFNIASGTVAMSGWGMTLSNGTEEGVAQGVTGSDGCITFYVNPETGPWEAIEEDREGWEQDYAYVGGGITYLNQPENALACRFFEGVTISESDTEYRCDFFNQPIPEDDGNGGNNGTSTATSTGPFTLTVSITGDGDGSVVSGDGLINCISTNPESDCTETYAASTTVNLTATAVEGSNFDSSWTSGFGTCTASTTPCQLVMTQNVALIAHFGLNATTTTTSDGGGGGRRSSGRSNNNDDDGNDSDDSIDLPEGQVLGEQVSVVPEGAPDAGAGGAAPQTNFALAPYCAVAAKRFSAAPVR